MNNHHSPSLNQVEENSSSQASADSKDGYTEVTTNGITEGKCVYNINTEIVKWHCGILDKENILIHLLAINYLIILCVRVGLTKFL